MDKAGPRQRRTGAMRAVRREGREGAQAGWTGSGAWGGRGRAGARDRRRAPDRGKGGGGRASRPRRARGRKGRGVAWMVPSMVAMG